MNFRGSTGFGKAFTNAGNMEWGAAMHNDLVDAVDWAEQKGIADRNSIAIMSVSYGVVRHACRANLCARCLRLWCRYCRTFEHDHFARNYSSLLDANARNVKITRGRS